MSLYQYANEQRHVIDLTDGPVLDLTRASYFAADQGALEEAANRLLLTLPDRSSPARSTGGQSTAAVTADFYVRTARPSRRIDVKAVVVMTAVAAVGILLMALAASAQY